MCLATFDLKQGRALALEYSGIPTSRSGAAFSAWRFEGDKYLGAAATDAISKWRFYPAKKDGKPIEEPARINVVFRLNGEQIRARLVWPETCCWWK